MQYDLMSVVKCSDTHCAWKIAFITTKNKFMYRFLTSTSNLVSIHLICLFDFVNK